MHSLLLWQQRLHKWGMAPLLRLAAAGWGRILVLRRKAYQTGVLPSWTPPVPCVSVGNIASGGGGKTPVALWLLQWAAAQKLQACLLTRGYGANPPTLPFVVEPERIRDWREAGDEPLLLARQAPESKVVVDPDRRRGVRHALAVARPELCIMDDGMQHLRLGRHCNLVLLRLEDLEEGWGRVIPSGQWREPASALAAADAFLVKASPEAFAAVTDLLHKRVGRFERPVFQFSLEAQGLQRVADSGSLASLVGRSYLFVSGIAGNEQAAATAARYMKNPPAGTLFFDDHHAYTVADCECMESERNRLGAEFVICTQKDAVKLAGIEASPLHERLYALSVGASFQRTLYCDVIFPQWWENWWQRHGAGT